MGFGASSSSVLKTTITISICGFVDVRTNGDKQQRGRGREKESCVGVLGDVGSVCSTYQLAPRSRMAA